MDWHTAAKGALHSWVHNISLFQAVCQLAVLCLAVRLCYA